MTHEEYKDLEDKVIDELFKLWANKELFTEFNGPAFVENKQTEILEKYNFLEIFNSFFGSEYDFLTQAKFLYEMKFGKKP